jgi:hypothetical protein
MEFVNSMRKKGQLIMGIGHRVKSVSNYQSKNYSHLFFFIGCNVECLKLK